MSTMISKLRSENKNVLASMLEMLLLALRIQQVSGYPELKIMEGLYDAMALGNHEFDLGPEILSLILAGFNPLTGQPFGAPVALPILCANANVAGFPMLQPSVQPSVVKEVGNLKIGIFGVIPMTLSTIHLTSLISFKTHTSLPG